MKRLLLILLAAVMVFSIFACTKKENEKPAGTTAPGTTGGPDVPPATTTQPTTTTEDKTKPDLPEITFDGADFRVATKEGLMRQEVFADETATNIREQAIWERNAAVEDTYDIVIDTYLSYDGTVSGQVSELIDVLFAEDDLYDVALTYACGTSPLVVGGFVVNWMNLQYNDFTKYYWIDDVNKNFMFDEAIYTTVGDMCVSTLTYTYAMFYNRTEGDKILTEDEEKLTDVIFEKIADNEWTIDYFISVISDVYTDIDDTTGVSPDDFYGFTAEALTNLDIYPFAFDIPMVIHDAETVLECVFKSEKTATAVDKVNQLYWESNGSYCNTDPGAYVKFAEGEALFTTTWLNNCFGRLAQMEDQYTILPYPMFDENQDKYRTGAMDNYSVMTIPWTCSNLELVSVITEALNYESRERVFPIYYEESLQKQYTRDPESIEMLDILMDGRTFDLATTFVTNLAMCFRSAVANKSGDFLTFYNEREENFNLTIEKLIEQYEFNKDSGKE